MNCTKQISDICTAYRVTGHGPIKVLLLHALTGGPDAADRDGVRGWWGPVFSPGAPFAEDYATVWTPNLFGSCYGTTEPDQFDSLPTLNTRMQAEVLANWIQSHNLDFDLLVGPSLGGMVALELAYLLPDKFRALGVIGCGARSDAWLWGINEIQRAILSNDGLSDTDAMDIARRAAMLTFRTPASLGERFKGIQELRDWLSHHGRTLAARFKRVSYLALLEAMDGHDLGRERGGLVSAMSKLTMPLFVLALHDDQMISASAVEEMLDSAKEAGMKCEIDWIKTKHGHDSFFIEWPQVLNWLNKLVCEVVQ